MAEAITEVVRRYVLDGGDEDLRRLRISEVTAATAERAFGSVGVGHGWAAIDSGGGPIGGLAVLAEMVGPVGRVVVGVDVSAPAGSRARRRGGGR